MCFQIETNWNYLNRQEWCQIWKYGAKLPGYLSIPDIPETRDGWHIGKPIYRIHRYISYTLNRKTLTSFVWTKSRGSVVITKPLALRMSLCDRKAYCRPRLGRLSTIFLCKYTKVMWLCKSKGFHNSFLRVYFSNIGYRYRGSYNRYKLDWPFHLPRSLLVSY